METIEIIVEETVQPIILEVYQETTPPIVLESFEGKSGYSAYEIALLNGFEGTEAEWLESLKGADGTGGVWGGITGTLSSQTDLQTALEDKVQKIDGYSLTKNDFTDVLKAKLDSITEIFTTALKITYDDASAWVTDVGLQLKTDFDILIATGARLITNSEITKISNTSGTNSGDETTTTIRTKLGISTLSGSNTGDETSATIVSKLGYTPSRLFFSGSDGSIVTNTTTITPTYTQLIQAGTFVSGDVIDLLYRAVSTIAKSSASSIYVYVNTTNSLATGSPLQVAILTNALRTLQMSRTLAIKGATTRVTTSTSSANADVVLTGASTLLTINWAIDQYFIFAIGHTVASATETLTGDCFRITKN